MLSCWAPGKPLIAAIVTGIKDLAWRWAGYHKVDTTVIVVTFPVTLPVGLPVHSLTSHYTELSAINGMLCNETSIMHCRVLNCRMEIWLQTSTPPSPHPPPPTSKSTQPRVSFWPESVVMEFRSKVAKQTWIMEEFTDTEGEEKMAVVKTFHTIINHSCGIYQNK